MELMRGCSPWADLLMASEIQDQYTKLSIRELQCCACVRKASTCCYGSSEYRFFSFRNSFDVLGFNLWCFWEVRVFVCQYFPNLKSQKG